MEQGDLFHNNPGKPDSVNPDASNKYSITCSNVPEGLFDSSAAKKHFSKFGKVHRIRLLPKKQICVVEYEQEISVQRALLNAGAFDGFMFDVTRTKARIRRKSKRDEDPDWVPDSDVEEELSAMGGTTTYRVPRQKPMEIDVPKRSLSPKKALRPVKQIIMKKKFEGPVKPRGKPLQSEVFGGDAPVIVTTQTSLSTTEAAAELHQLRSRVSLTPDEKWRTLDARDRILRSWGGAGSKVKVGGPTIGTCPDMCPEKELLHRQAEHQVMTLETIVDSDGLLEPWRAVKQYSRSSADQEMPMCYELRPAKVLMATCAYLLCEIADTTRQVSLADWFHFMWDRLRGIRKDITQQALCCADSICLVEICARFHAHCAARLADLEHTQFDQKLNTDNLTKCLQTLKHMYSDVQPQFKPREAEFRGYIALLNLGDANFWWEIKQLPDEIQRSEPIIFAVKVFMALDNNNYVRFFRLVRDEATYLQACILLRYFNDVRARGLARIVKAYAPRGGSKYPAEELMNSLAFETIESMKSFVNHYGLRFSKVDSELNVILDRNQFIEDSDPYPLARALSLIETKRRSNVADIISGGNIPQYDYKNHTLHASFTSDGKIKLASLTAQDLRYNTTNDTNKDIESLKLELQRLAGNGKTFMDPPFEVKKPNFVKPAAVTPPKPLVFSNTNGEKSFTFQRAGTVDVPDSIKKSPEITNGAQKLFTFSPPEKTNMNRNNSNLFTSSNNKNLFSSSQSTRGNDGKNLFKSTVGGSLFNKLSKDENKTEASKSIFANAANTNFAKTTTEPQNIFSNAQSIFSKSTDVPQTNIFAKAPLQTQLTNPSSVFRGFAKPTQNDNLFNKDLSNNKFVTNGEASNLSPGTLFKQANDPFSAQNKLFTVLQSKNKVSVASNIFKSVETPKNNDIYEFNDDSNNKSRDELEELENEKKKIEAAIKEEEMKELEEKRRMELQEKQKEMKRLEEARKKEELKKLEEQRKLEEQKKQAELKRKLEEEHQAELDRKAKELDRIFREKVEKESEIVSEELVNKVNRETVSILLKEEMDILNNIITYTKNITDEMVAELLDEICTYELKAELFRTKNLMKKWFNVWRNHLSRNLRRRHLLEDTPVWLPDKTPFEEANCLRRLSERATLSHMNAIHRGYKFKNEPNEIPPPKTYDLVEIIRSPLLKRMKQINYPYDKCFFWKITLVSPGTCKWFCKKINIQTWLLHAFRSKDNGAEENLIHIQKQSWNNLMDFATSVTLINRDKLEINEDSLEGTNGVIFYVNNDDLNVQNIESVLKQKHPYHIVPIAIITTPISNAIIQNDLENKLSEYVSNNVISDFKIFIIEPANIAVSLDSLTKSALKWLAKRCPKSPPLEIDTLKSICQRYLGNEIWHRLKSDTDIRFKDLMNDIKKLVLYYNTAIDKLTEVITDEDWFNYPGFPIEFKSYLDSSVPCPKPYEYIPNSLRNSENTNVIKNIMQNLKLVNPSSPICPKNTLHMQEQVRQYCNQIGWFKNPETVTCKVLSLLPNNCSEELPVVQCDNFIQFFEQYNLIDTVNIIVYEKISILKKFGKQFTIYKKSAMEEFRQMNWMYNSAVLTSLKHKADLREDELDWLLAAKRRKIDDSYEYLQIEEKDCSMVDDTIRSVDRSISNCNNYKKVVSDLEMQLNEGKKKSDKLEQLLKMALNDV
ncbi:uncharacterized protein LOC123709619 isoform X1 [Pieris brassicae]|uniref:uncharacterized protein LOC123709619 isoform X1 n=1 Tax=Pieris brassicae TaxID=7116 RepID=UPI001E65F7A3|nr:uncharacterized protein LOC123709619 isoform X1 [Pieris brassicae]